MVAHYICACTKLHAILIEGQDPIQLSWRRIYVTLAKFSPCGPSARVPKPVKKLFLLCLPCTCHVLIKKTLTLHTCDKQVRLVVEVSEKRHTATPVVPRRCTVNKRSSI